MPFDPNNQYGVTQDQLVHALTNWAESQDGLFTIQKQGQDVLVWLKTPPGAEPVACLYRRDQDGTWVTWEKVEPWGAIPINIWNQARKIKTPLGSGKPG